MLVLVTYDVSVTEPGGQKRLSRVAKVCQNYAQYVVLKNSLEKIINKEKDSVRFYRIGSKWDTKIQHIGAKKPLDIANDILNL
jgi:CRISPR-associated protein Cas2